MNKLEQAMDFHKQGKLDEAEETYKDLLNEEPDNADVMYLYATLKMSQNKFEETVELSDKCIELNDSAPAFFQLKGSALARLGKTDEALETINKGLKGNPNLYQSQIVAGHLNYVKGNKSKSKEHFNNAIKINNTNPEAHVNLARIQIDEGEISKASNILRDLELKHPDQASIKMMLGQAFIESGAYSYAENYFQKVLAMHPEYALASLYLGIAKLETGDSKEAEKLIVEFNQQHENIREGRAALGLLMFKNNNFKLALQHLEAAIGTGAAPLSWKAAYVESMSRMGEFQPAIQFYEERQKHQPSPLISYRLGELYEKSGKHDKATKEYQEQKEGDIKFIAAQLGLARCSLHQGSPEKAEKHCQKVLEQNTKHAEASYLLTHSFLEQGKEKRAFELLQFMDLSTYNDSYKRVFKLLLSFMYDNEKNYDKAFETFSSIEAPELPPYHALADDDLKAAQEFSTEVDDEINTPVFIVGAKSSGIHEFVNWLFEQDIKVLNDRLVTRGREDILHSYVPMDKLESADEEMIRLERKIYNQKAKALLAEVEEKFLPIDCLYINPYQLILVKKFFPEAKIVLLTRDSQDIWLNQKVFGQEPVGADEWEEARHQIVSLGLSLTQISLEDWLENDSSTKQTLEKIFEKELEDYKPKSTKFWLQTHFPKGHWKNYKKYLGKQA